MSEIDVTAGQELDGTTVVSGDFLNVEKGGIIHQTTIDGGAIDHIAGTSFNTTLLSGAIETVENGGVSNNAVVDGGAISTVQAGGTINHIDILAGAQVEVAAGGQLSDADLQQGGLLLIDSGATVAAGSAIVFHGSPAATDTQAGVVITTTAAGAVLPGVTFYGFGAGNTITINDGNSATVSALSWSQETNSQGTLSIVQGNSTYMLTLNGSYQSSNFVTTSGASGSETVSFTTPACFLRDTMIETPAGAVPVQQIIVGDEVLTWSAAGTSTQKIIWISCERMTASDVDSHPVCIRKDALSDGQPSCDLLVTPEHCLFLNGTFIPVRMLINGRSIVSDTTLKTFEVYHIETQDHSIVCANGAWTESFLDTGNHRGFTERDGVTSICNIKTWQNDAAAPLMVDRASVEPLYVEIQDRAVGSSLYVTPSLPELTHEKHLRLLTDAGKILYPVEKTDNHVEFTIPANVHTVQIISRASRPSDVIGPFLDDRRWLGVAVGKISFEEGDVRRIIDEHLTAPVLAGWHDLEGQDQRWTSGDAVLSLGQSIPGSTGVLSMRIAAAGPYRLKDDVATHKKAEAA